MQVLGYASFLLFFSQNALLELALHCLDRQNGTIITHTLSLELYTYSQDNFRPCSHKASLELTFVLTAVLNSGIDDMEYCFIVNTKANQLHFTRLLKSTIQSSDPTWICCYMEKCFKKGTFSFFLGGGLYCQTRCAYHVLIQLH